VLPSAGGSRPLTLDRDQVSVATGPVGAGQIVLPNAGDETWATIRLDSGHWARLPAVMSTLTDNAARAVLWNALRSAVPDGLVTPELAVQIVIAGLASELEVVRPQILRWITDSIPIFLASGPARDSATAELASAVHQLLAHALPASSAQLTAARGWIALTDDVDTLRRWTRADHDLAGLVVDEELRWAILERRAALGDLSLDQIETAYADDHSASGLIHATRCRALRPDAAAKAAAWAELLDPATTLSQYQLNALAGGIWVAGQEQLTQPYAARWFVDLPAMSEFRGGYALTGIATLSFPALAVDLLTLERADILKHRLELPAGLRRIASDGADELRRAIAVQASARSGQER
jgi:aminopeptidase N